MKRSLLLAAAIVSVISLSFGSLAGAVEYGGVGGKPANPRSDNPRTKSIFIFTLDKGQTADDAVRIYNNTNTERTISVYPVDAVLASGGAFSCAQKVEARKDVGGWLHLSNDSVTVAANDSVLVPFTVQVPANADTGEHDGCIAIQDSSMNTAQKTQSGVVLGFRSAIRVSVTIPGKIIKQLAFQKVVTKHLDNGDYLITPTVRNSGNVSLDSQVSAALQPIVGTSVKPAASMYPILPRSTASWNFEVKSPFWGGLYRAVVKITYDSNTHNGVGATNASNKTISSTSAMVVAAPAPLALVVEIVVLAAIVGLVVWLVRQHRHRHHVRNHWETYTVKKGDSVNSVAEHYNVPWKRLASANKLKAPYSLSAGQELKVPPTQKG